MKIGRPGGLAIIRFGIALLVSLLYLGGAFELAELKLLDSRFNLVKRPSSSAVTLVAIDPRSIREIGYWPWPRSLHAQLITHLNDAGADRIAFDIDFSSPSRDADDEALENALAGLDTPAILPGFLQSLDPLRHDGNMLSTLPLERFRQHVDVASVNVIPDADGLARRMSTRLPLGGLSAPTMSAILVRASDQSDNRYIVDFGIGLDGLPVIAYADVIAGNYDPLLVQGRKVVVGTTASELGDILAVPVYGALPGVMFQVLAAESLRQGRALRTAPAWTNLVGIAVFSLLLGPLLTAAGWRRGLFLTVATPPLLFLGSCFVQAAVPVVLEMVSWSVAVVLTFVAGLLTQIQSQSVRLLKQHLALIRKEKYMARVVDNNFDAIITVDSQGSVISCNRAATTLFGYAAEELLGRSISDLICWPRGEKSEAVILAELKGLSEYWEPVELRGLRGDGLAFPLEVAATTLGEDDADTFILTLRDISARKESEQALKASEERFRSLVANIPAALYLSDRNGVILLANGRFEEFFGISVREAVGVVARELFPAELAAQLVFNEELVAQTGHACEEEQEIVFNDGTTHLVIITKFPVKGSDGQVIGVGTIATDVTEQRKAEADLRQAQKMDAVGQLTGGVAHDFNNLLAVMLGNAQLLQERLGEEDKLAAAISKAAVSGAELTQRLLAFSRKQPLTPRSLALGDLIKDMQEMLTRSLGAAVEVATDISTDTWDITADQSQVENAVLNLSINARDAMPKGGTLTIRTVNVTFGPEDPAPGDMDPGEYVCLTVSDSGTGMPPEVLQRVLEPFFTTKEAGKGTGLGLSMVYGFVKQSGGHMEIDSEFGCGTTMRLYFPRAGEQVDAEAGHVEEAEPRGSGQLILVVESAENVRTLVQTFLEDLGYEVAAVADAAEAFNLLESGGFPFAAILTEVQLPGGVDGFDIAHRTHADFPGIALAFMSGGNDNLDEQDADIQAIPVLRKPFVRGELAQAMRATLQPASSDLGGASAHVGGRQ